MTEASDGGPDIRGRRGGPQGQAHGAYRPIRDYALVGDCHGAALVARDGSVDWCCLRRFDAAPVFWRILDAAKGGFFQVCPEGHAEA